MHSAGGPQTKPDNRQEAEGKVDKEKPKPNDQVREDRDRRYPAQASAEKGQTDEQTARDNETPPEFAHGEGKEHAEYRNGPADNGRQ